MTDSKSSPPASVHPQTWKFDYPIIHAETREQWRTWLTDNHTSGRGVWLCSWRTTTSLQLSRALGARYIIEYAGNERFERETLLSSLVGN